MINKARVKFVQHAVRRLVGLILVVLPFYFLIALPLSAQSEGEIKVMTFNLRYGTADDGENSWQFRKDNVVQTIKNFKPGLLGLQEALQLQIEEFLKQMPEYGYAGVGRDDGKSAGELSCIFYLKNRFEVDSTETFWFSETPNIIASKSWGNNITRICTWIRATDKISGRKFYYFNLHLDHESQPSREKSAELLIRRINEKKLPVLLSGDFNCGDENKAIKTILSDGMIDTYRALHQKQPDEGTFNSFKGETSGDKIDFIFMTKEFLVRESNIVRTNYNGKYPSDHFPVTAIINFKN